MNEYTICTDATCDMTQEYFEQHDVECLPMLYSVDGQDYFLMGEGASMGMKEFYQKMRAGSTCKTAQVTADTALKMLRPIAQNGSDILYVGFSSALSGTYESVAQAMSQLAEEFPQQKFLAADTLGASMGEGLMLHHAVLNRDAGMTIEQNHTFLEEKKQNFVHYFTVDDLHHLHRGGRVSRLTAIVGSFLGIKPVLHVNSEGKLINIDKVKGRQKALRTMVAKMQDKMTEKNQPVFISHGDALEDAEFVANILREELGVKDITINFIGPVIGSHSGPGTIALFFMGKDRVKN